MANIANLSVKLSADATQFTSTFDRAAKDLEKFDKEAEKMAAAARQRAREVGGHAAAALASPFAGLKGLGQGGSVGGALEAVAGPVAALLKDIPFVGGALGGLVSAAAGIVSHLEKVGDEMLAIDKQARQLGVSTEFLSSMMAAAGSHADEFVEGLRHLARNFGELQLGSKEAERKFDEFFGTIGSARAARGKSFEQFIGEVADQLQQMPNAAQRAAAGMDLFGKSGQVTIDKLAKGAEGLKDVQEKMTFKGVAFSSADVEGFFRAKEAVKDIELSFEGVTRQLAIALAPLVKDIAEGIAGWAKGVDLKGKVREWVEGFVDVLEAVVNIVIDVTNDLSGLLADIKNFQAGFLGNPTNPFQGTAIGHVKIGRPFDTGGGGDFGDNASDEAAEAAAKLGSAVKRAEKEMRDELATMGMTADEAKIFKLAQDGATASMLHQAEVLAQQKKSIEHVFGKPVLESANIFDKFRQQKAELGRLAEQGVNTAGAMRKLTEEFDTIKRTTAAGIFQASLTDFEKVNAQIEQTTRLLNEGLISKATAGRDLLKMVTEAESKLPKVQNAPALERDSAAEISFRTKFETSQLGQAANPQERIANLLGALKEIGERQTQLGKEMLEAIQNQTVVGVQ